MTAPEFPYPHPEPLYRLDVYDGLTINAARWNDEREYHRRRQNVHYQGLHEPGILSGLGVRILQPSEIPDEMSRENVRWVEIEPGLALDLEGNPIVIPREPRPDRCFPIRDPIDEADREMTVYLYVCYHDPVVGVDRSQTNGRGVLREWFEIDQQTEPLTGREIELCRVRLRGRHYELYSPQNYLDPQINELDFRYRRRARWRPWKTVRVGVLDNAEFEEFNEEIDRSIDGLGDLVESLDGLYPQLHGVREIDRVQMGRENTSLTFFIIESRPDGDLESQRSPSEIAHHYDALYLGSAWQNILLNEVQIRLLRDYIEAGGMLWIEVPQNAERLPILSSLESIYGGKQDWQDLDRRHPVRTQPFAFQRLPAGEALEPIQFKVLGDILLCEGLLSLAWGVSFPLELDRAEIRAAQELGINILNFFQYLREQKHFSNWK